MIPAETSRATWSEYMSFSQPIKGAIAANIRRIMKLRMESTVALMSEKVIWLMYPLRMGVAKPRKI